MESMSALTTSETIAALAEALSQAQGEFGPVLKKRTAKIQSTKGAYSYNYADLSDVLDAVRPALKAHGLSVVQSIVWAEGGGPLLVTRLLHASGEWIESTYRLTAYERPQETGSALTFARRYTLSALLGVAAEEDDDAQMAQQAEPPNPPQPDPDAERRAEFYRDIREGITVWELGQDERNALIETTIGRASTADDMSLDELECVAAALPPRPTEEGS